MERTKNVKITPEWLRKHAAADEGVEFSTGVPNVSVFNADADAIRLASASTTVAQYQVQEPLKKPEIAPVFGRFIQFWRLDKGYSVASLARAADLDTEEIECIETDVHYVPEPRTVSQLAGVLKIPFIRLTELAGLAKTDDVKFSQHAMRFATRAQSLDQLSREQKDALHEFVKFLADQK